ncbi:TylF/MycF/NovP-related O-methyltransferase [Methylobacterium frigidaeris]|uniref:Methyltransferase n=1 Tax=Methylobacterium frigidaeris TaxID=2038277 RepID=A0AA37HJ81_9HYPH|nr:TylF/MycF/NovP-related O-methyltransferase [Methylobacterium frigidaeris]GJD66763.1 hypothetical protein MPEAHAMD_6961 [Methylobacterium frigidaeris]
MDPFFSMPVLPIPGETAASVLQRLRRVHFPAIYNADDRFFSYKLISLFYAISFVGPSGDFAEFGVYKGRCARFLLELIKDGRKLHLFDSFEGLPEDWVGDWKKGAFAMKDGDIPTFDSSKATVHKGWFSDSVPRFAATHDLPLSFLHIDCDLYSSTKDVLWPLNGHIVPGSILLFDEYQMESAGQVDDGEHRALVEWASMFGRGYEYLWRTEWMQVAVRVTK